MGLGHPACVAIPVGQKLRAAGDVMELTWIAIAASLLMGGGGLLIFIWSVRSHQFKSFEDVKYQVFWSDLEAAAGKPATKAPEEEQQHGSSTKDS